MEKGIYLTTVSDGSGRNFDGFYFPVIGDGSTYDEIVEAITVAISVLSDNSGMMDYSLSVAPLVTLLQAMQPRWKQIKVK